jgi:hypothetical protein
MSDINAIFKVSSADPGAALLLSPIIVREGWEAMHWKSSVIVFAYRPALAIGASAQGTAFPILVE